MPQIKKMPRGSTPAGYSRTAVQTQRLLLRHQDLNVRKKAALALGRMRTASAVGDLIGALRNASILASTRPYGGSNGVEAARALGRISNSKAISGLIDQGLNNKDEFVVAEAARQLGMLKAKPAVKALLEALPTDTAYDNQKGTASISALASIGGDEAIDGLVKHLRESKLSDPIKGRIAATLGEIGDARAVKCLACEASNGLTKTYKPHLSLGYEMALIKIVTRDPEAMRALLAFKEEIESELAKKTEEYAAGRYGNELVIRNLTEQLANIKIILERIKR